MAGSPATRLGHFQGCPTEDTNTFVFFYIYDANFIKGVPIKSRHRSELQRAYEQVYKWCEARGFKLTLQRMDNEHS